MAATFQHSRRTSPRARRQQEVSRVDRLAFCKLFTSWCSSGSGGGGGSIKAHVSAALTCPGEIEVPSRRHSHSGDVSTGLRGAGASGASNAFMNDTGLGGFILGLGLV
ncbi:hypothetical protein E2C01_007326 [Portunus trituberculatus]|uniref:Uncharacterized protein n=1 Tax=Portunus trituberculatus TaxID=210409 RepID=A0A5B7CZ55_PORTR|nr:hypothetical protein [Portunus trituberculatus]